MMDMPGRVAPGELLIEVAAATVVLGARTVLHDVDLTVAAGEIVAVVGPNGAGKTTLLAAVAGDVGLRSGRAVLDGRPLPAWSTAELARRRAVLTQDTTVNFPFTVSQIVAMGRTPWAGTDRADDDLAVVAESLLLTEIDHLATRPYPLLSGGERARAALARVLAQQAQLVLLDEPTAALDIRHQELVFRLARARADAGDGVVVVIHDLSLAAAHADRVVIIDQGAVVAAGPPDEVLVAALLSDVYRHDIDVVAHPRTGQPLVLPHRRSSLP